MKYLFANWKMYLGMDESQILCQHLAEAELPATVSVAIFPNTLALSHVRQSLPTTSFAVGAQNVAVQQKGAFTGETSSQMFADVGVEYALVGHSERRHLFGETNADVRRKVEQCIESNIIPVLCIGESKQDVDNGKATYRVEKQITRVLDGLDLKDTSMIVAYEPVWAISNGGDGVACDPEKANEMHTLIKEKIATYTDATIPVLYGGSANTENAVSFMSQTQIDGLLVGSASTKADSFTEMINQAGTLS